MSTYWNGMEAPARRGSAVVDDDPAFPHYWARSLVGQRIPVVEVRLDGVTAAGGVAYLDDRMGDGWRKVTTARGSSLAGHRDVAVVAGSFMPAVYLQGAGSRPEEGVEVASPSEFAAVWNDRDDLGREAMLGWLLDNSRWAHRCFMENHDGRLAGVRAQQEAAAKATPPVPMDEEIAAALEAYRAVPLNQAWEAIAARETVQERERHRATEEDAFHAGWGAAVSRDAPKPEELTDAAEAHRRASGWSMSEGAAVFDAFLAGIAWRMARGETFHADDVDVAGVADGAGAWVHVHVGGRYVEISPREALALRRDLKGAIAQAVAALAEDKGTGR